MLQFVFYRRGWRQPLDATSECEVWSGLRLVGILPGALVCQIVGQFVSGALLSKMAADRLDSAMISRVGFPLAPLPSLGIRSTPLPRLVKVRHFLRGWRNIGQ